jgi:hypothetical protein
VVTRLSAGSVEGLAAGLEASLMGGQTTGVPVILHPVMGVISGIPCRCLTLEGSLLPRAVRSW